MPNVNKYIKISQYSKKSGLNVSFSKTCVIHVILSIIITWFGINELTLFFQHELMIRARNKVEVLSKTQKVGFINSTLFLTSKLRCLLTKLIIYTHFFKVFYFNFFSERGTILQKQAIGQITINYCRFFSVIYALLTPCMERIQRNFIQKRNAKIFNHYILTARQHVFLYM